MKPILLASVLLCLAAQAQSTYINQRLNFVNGNAVTTLTIGTNVLVKIINSQGQNLTGATMSVQYPGGPVIRYDLTDPALDPTGKPFLGPATVTFNAQGTAAAVAYFLLQYETVNVTLPTQGVVVPAGSGASVSFQMSTNLTDWTAATSGVYPKSGQNRFFRMSL